MMANGISWMAWWQDADMVVRGVFVLLVALSLVSWMVILFKALRLQHMVRGERRAAQGLDHAVHLHAIGEQLAPDQPSARLLHAVLTRLGEEREAVSERLSLAARDLRLELESGLTLLATIGNTAPFIGLFGTVWGIMHALHGLGGGKALTMDMVAGPVAEALVATAAGLFTALPAVVGYNLLLRRHRVLSGLIDGNAARLARLAAMPSDDATVVSLHPTSTRRN